MNRRGFSLILAVCALTAACAQKPKAVSPGANEHGHGSHAPAGKVTLSWLAQTALPMPNLGNYHRSVTTRSPVAQAYFDQGLRLMYGFNHDEAVRSFAKAGAIDPTCAMCFWGVSFALGPNYNMPLLADRSALAYQALQRARMAAPVATPVERALIGALAARYPSAEYRNPDAQQPYNEAFADAMRGVAQAYPNDTDVQVLFAESLMDVTPWKLWTLDGRPAKNTLEVVQTLETAIQQDENHPGANHYYIHAVEASQTPERAVLSANRLAALMPAAGHMVHMPAHTYQRVGRYADASEANRKAIEADIEYMARTRPWGYYAMYMAHNYGFLAFSASMEGRSAESISAAKKASAVMRHEMPDSMSGMDFFTAESILAMVRFGKFDELLAEPRPGPADPVLTAFWLHGHGMALASKGKLDAARADLTELQGLASAVKAGLHAGKSSAADLMNVAAKVLEARIAEKAGEPGTLALWTDAVGMADKLPYAEPADWFYPVRHYQGAALLAAGRYAAAEAVYRTDLMKNPMNGWALFGLAKALRAQNRTAEADVADAQFKKAWARADIQLTTTAF